MGNFFSTEKRGQAGDRKFGLFLPGNIESWGCLSPFYSFMLLRGSPALLVFFNDGPSNKRRRYLVSSTDSTVAIFLELCCIHWNTFQKWVIFWKVFVSQETSGHFLEVLYFFSLAPSFPTSAIKNILIVWWQTLWLTLKERKWLSWRNFCYHKKRIEGCVTTRVYCTAEVIIFSDLWSYFSWPFSSNTDRFSRCFSIPRICRLNPFSYDPFCSWILELSLL